MAVKKKAAPKKRAATKKKAAAPKKKAVSKRKAVNGPRSKKERRETPIPKYHLNHRDWDRSAVMAAICNEMIASSKGLAYICRDNPDFPNVQDVFRWMNEEEQGGGDMPISDMYARAKGIQVDFMADEIVDIGDNQVANPVIVDGLPLQVDGKLVEIVDGPAVQHAKLRSDNRKWIASKLKPRKYGDRLELSGDPERPLGKLGDDELDTQLAALLKKLNQ